MEYTDDLELLFKQEGEKSEAMSLLHNISHIKYNKLSVFINIPVIVLSSIVGFIANIDLFEKQNILLGAISLLVATIKTLDSYFDWTKKSEAHRMTSLAYAKISKFIQIQLSLDRANRLSAEDLLSVITNDLQNLHDAEPTIDKDVIAAFNTRYKDEPTSKPNITNGLTSIRIVKGVDKPKESNIRITVVDTPAPKAKINI